MWKIAFGHREYKIIARAVQNASSFGNFLRQSQSGSVSEMPLTVASSMCANVATTLLSEVWSDFAGGNFYVKLKYRLSISNRRGLVHG